MNIMATIRSTLRSWADPDSTFGVVYQSDSGESIVRLESGSVPTTLRRDGETFYLESAVREPEGGPFWLSVKRDELQASG